MSNCSFRCSLSCADILALTDWFTSASGLAEQHDLNHGLLFVRAPCAVQTARPLRRSRSRPEYRADGNWSLLAPLRPTARTAQSHPGAARRTSLAPSDCAPPDRTLGS